MPGKKNIPIEDRFWSKVDVRGPNDCWEWTGAVSSKGSGNFSIGRKNITAYRMAWTLLRGCIPGDKILCHTCDNRRCCNPNHIYLGTHLENARDRDERCRRHTRTGEDDPKHILTEEQVRFIRSHYTPRSREYSQFALARRFGVSRTAVQAILDGRNWKHIL